MVIVREDTNSTLENAATINATDVLGDAFYDVRAYATLLVYLKVLDKSGTNPTLDVKVQSSYDGTTWFDLTSGAFTQIITTATPNPLGFTNFGRYIRVFATVGGTSTPTFTGVTCVISAKS